MKGGGGVSAGVEPSLFLSNSLSLSRPFSPPHTPPILYKSQSGFWSSSTPTMDSQQFQSSDRELFSSGASGSTRTRVSIETRVSSRTQVELMGLNERLASYMEKVRSLQQQKVALEAELQRLKLQGPTRLLDVYQQELKEQRHLLDTLVGAKDRLEVQTDNLAAELVTLQRR